ncbi:hypothetical protein [Pseudarcicella hirudinis]|uniref:hypothetical protein n=1 Tax=Pseudarcicella hirudinis TaxID=1079859 RepID=UPI0035E8D340
MKTSTNKQLHSLLNQTGLMSEKESLIYSFSEGLTSSSKELKEYQAIALIKHLRKISGEQKVKDEGDMKQSTRRYIISLWYKIENAQTAEEKKAALQKCFEWVQKHFKQPLNSFEKEQLFKIKLAAEQVLKDRAKAIRRALNESKD